eukprot:2444523-Rhodomonas_salina.2
MIQGGRGVHGEGMSSNPGGGVEGTESGGCCQTEKKRCRMRGKVTRYVGQVGERCDRRAGYPAGGKGLGETKGEGWELGLRGG